MPSSLVFAALVLAWLAVLVPVIARRRQMVPRPADVDLSARVLPRSVGAPVNEEPPVTHTPGGRGGSAVATVGSRGSVAMVDDETDAHDDEDVDRYADDEYLADDRYVEDDRYADREYEDDRYADEPAPAPRSYRPGRGGFDPEAAAVAAQSRYAFRQRVAVGLIAVAVLSALAALIVAPVLWSLHVAADVVLVGYLVFLRRQTRIEEELRERRAARLSGERRALEARRDRQAEHDERMAAVEQHYARDRDDDAYGAYDDGVDDGYGYDEEDEYEDYAERYLDRYSDDEYDEYDEYDEDRRGPEEAVTRLQPAPRTPTPALPEGLELVSDSDDDPAFHPLDGRESMPSYRRAAGA